MSEASIRTQWKKGQSGNPKGRPKKPKPLTGQGEMLTCLARFLLDQPAYIFGRAEPITRQARFMMDIAARAENGDYKAARFLLDLADRGDRRRLQALRLAQCAKTKRAARFERRNADKISPRTPGPRPDQEHIIMPAREIRTEQLKPLKFAAKKRGYDSGYWYDPDPLAGIPKHLTKEERDRRDALALATMAAAPPAPAREPSSPPRTQAETAPKSAPETPSGTGLKTGPITGLSNTLKPHQAVDGTDKSPINMRDAKSFVVPPAAVDGASVNGRHHNGSPA